MEVTRKRKMWKKPRADSVKKLRRDVKAIKRSQELKWFDTAVAAPIAGSIYPLNLVPLGDDSVTRDGRKIMMKSIECRINGFISPGTTPPSPRYLIVYDKVCNGALPAVTDIMTGASSAVSFLNLNNRSRFRILYDNYVGFGNKDPGSAQAYQYFANATGSGGVFQDVKNLRVNLETIFKDTGSGTIAGTNTGALYVVFLGGGNATTGTETNFRIRFLDS